MIRNAVPVHVHVGNAVVVWILQDLHDGVDSIPVIVLIQRVDQGVQIRIRWVFRVRHLCTVLHTIPITVRVFGVRVQLPLVPVHETVFVPILVLRPPVTVIVHSITKLRGAGVRFWPRVVTLIGDLKTIPIPIEVVVPQTVLIDTVIPGFPASRVGRGIKVITVIPPGDLCGVPILVRIVVVSAIAVLIQSVVPGLGRGRMYRGFRVIAIGSTVGRRVESVKVRVIVAPPIAVFIHPVVRRIQRTRVGVWVRVIAVDPPHHRDRVKPIQVYIRQVETVTVLVKSIIGNLGGAGIDRGVGVVAVRTAKGG